MIVGTGVDLAEVERIRQAIERLREAISETGGNKAATTAMANLAEAIQGLVHHMRTEQQMIRDWVDSQAEQHREIRRLLAWSSWWPEMPKQLVVQTDSPMAGEARVVAEFNVRLLQQKRVEFVKRDGPALKDAALTKASLTLLTHHLALRPKVNPIASWRAAKWCWSRTSSASP